MFMLEGEWTGYRSSQQRVVHRTYHGESTLREKAFKEKVSSHHSIRYTDGTALYLRVVENVRRTKAQPEIRGYCSLIKECAEFDLWTVEALCEAKKNRDEHFKKLQEEKQAQRIAECIGAGI